VGRSGQEKHHPNYHKKFTEVLARVAAHPNRRYFVLKSIILNNLYGVDIMEEAVEICKLRLFLKLAAQVECSQFRRWWRHREFHGWPISRAIPTLDSFLTV
jgi:hypothetical protein